MLRKFIGCYLIFFIFGATPMFGQVTITVPGDYPTLREAFADINVATEPLGDVIIQLTASVTDNNSAVLTDAGGYSSVTIYPTVPGVVLSGSMGAPIIDLDGADNVTIDGRVNQLGDTADLTIRQTYSFANSFSVRLINDATYNTITYANIQTSYTSGPALQFGNGAPGGTLGNSFNVVSNCIFSPNVSSGNGKGIQSYNTEATATVNQSNEISGNHFIDFMRGIGPASIALIAGSHGFIVKDNHFYQTSAASLGNTPSTAILILQSTDHVVNGNYIGGNAPFAEGKWEINHTGNQFAAIKVTGIDALSDNSYNYIYGNTIKNIKSNVGITGINITEGNVNIGLDENSNVQGNTIGDITKESSLESDILVNGITSLSSTDTLAIIGNTIAGLKTDRTDQTQNGPVVGIYNLASKDGRIEQNTIGSETIEKSLFAASQSTSRIQLLAGIYNTGKLSSISNNTVQGLYNNSTLDNGGSITTNGIYCSASLLNVLISGNHIHNVTSSIGFTDSESNTVSGLIGISVGGSGSKFNVQGNTVSGLSYLNQTAHGRVTGIYVSGDANLSGNYIHSLSAFSSAYNNHVFGMYFNAGALGSVVDNNVIKLNPTGDVNVYGLYHINSKTNFYHNTVSIDGIGGVFNSAAFFSVPTNRNVNWETDVRNNIFVNTRSNPDTIENGRGGTHFAVEIGVFSNDLNIDHNNYYVSGTGAVFGAFENSADYFNNYLANGKLTEVTTLGAWKDAVNTITDTKPNDCFSVNVDPGFTDAVSTDVLDMLPTETSLAGDASVGITLDFSGTTRSETVPAMGALEYTVSATGGIGLNSFSPTAGPEGGSVTLTGSGFTGATKVTFTDGVDADYEVVSDTEITLTVPVGAATGAIAVTVPCGVLTSSTDFTVSAAPVISYDTPQDYPVNVAIDSLKASLIGTADSWAIAPALPAGLSFNSSTGDITGTPTTETTATTYTVTATNTDGDGTFDISISTGFAPANLSYTIADSTLTVETNMDAWNPSLDAATQPLEYTVSPDLPDGLSIDPDTGEISGNPTGVTDLTSYQVTVTNAYGSSTYDFQLATGIAPSGLSYGSVATGFGGNVISKTPTLTVAGTGTATYSIAPDLPTEITLNTTTGALTGNLPTEFGLKEFTVTVVNDYGSTQATASYAVYGVGAPVYSQESYSVGTSAFSTTPTINAYPVPVFTVSPSLPAGLTIDPDTGEISGTLTEDLTGSVTYTVTATIDIEGPVTSTTEITLVFNSAPTDLQLRPVEFVDSLALNTELGTFSTTDPDTGNTFTYTLVAGEGDEDNAAFQIVGDQLVNLVSFDFLVKDSYSIRVRTTDNGGLFYEKVLTLSILPRDTDGDAVPDYVEQTEGTDPEDALDYKDRDGDKVPDYIETIDGTDPEDKTDFKDSDGGGVPDYVETIWFPNFGLPATDPNQSADDDQDTDGDGVPDYEDVFPNDADESADADGDGIGDNADPDDDNDGVADIDDAFPFDPNETLDTDGDGIGNNEDTDDDGDGTLDIEDAFPLDSNEDVDFDGDGIGDNTDPDDDNDGVDDTTDDFPFDETESRDTDLDGIGDNTDPDIDGDGIENRADVDVNGDGSNDNGIDTDGDGINDEYDPDLDGDGVDNGLDNCPNLPNADQLDRDGDGIGDVCDTQEVNIAQAITPNGDGINDTWVIYNIENFPNNEIRVYNRWGKEVFAARNYKNDWDGTYRDMSSALPDSSSYLYQIDLDGDGTVDEQGWLIIKQ